MAAFMPQALTLTNAERRGSLRLTKPTPISIYTLSMESNWCCMGRESMYIQVYLILASALPPKGAECPRRQCGRELPKQNGSQKGLPSGFSYGPIQSHGVESMRFEPLQEGRNILHVCASVMVHALFIFWSSPHLYKTTGAQCLHSITPQPRIVLPAGVLYPVLKPLLAFC